eukprot:6159566-Alexandrium_andersonii.AAC.1
MQPGRSRSQLARRAKRSSPRLVICRSSEAPPHRSERWGCRAKRGTSGALSGKQGSEFPQIPSRGEGLLARRASWDCDL